VKGNPTSSTCFHSMSSSARGEHRYQISQDLKFRVCIKSRHKKLGYMNDRFRLHSFLILNILLHINKFNIIDLKKINKLQRAGVGGCTSTEQIVLAVLYLTSTGKNPSVSSPATLNSNRPFSTSLIEGLQMKPSDVI
jgi:hypothetical protein